MKNLKLAWAEIKRLVGRLVCRWAKAHDWVGEGMPVQKPGHRGGYAPVVCRRCETRASLSLSPTQLLEAKRACRTASKIRLVR